ATMMPALDWLQANGRQFGQPGPSLFFWGSGVLSSLLDNAPTYLSFLSAEMGAFISPQTTADIVSHIQAHGADLTGLSDPSAGHVSYAIRALHTYYPTQLTARDILPETAGMGLILGHPFYAKCLAAL